MLNYLKKEEIPDAVRELRKNLIDIECIKNIVFDVRDNGDKALYKYTKMFDGIDVDSFLVSEEEIESSFSSVSEEIIESFKVAIKNVEKISKMFEKKDISFKFGNSEIGVYRKPVNSACIYVPNGDNPYPSSAIMGVVPAKVAGVNNIYATTPPRGDMSAIVVASKLSGASAIYKVGGAHSIAAFAFGTETIPKVDMIAGPGGKYVNSAKALLFSMGVVGIDTLAGPSEILVIADKTADLNIIMAELKGQKEHKDSVAVLVTDSKKIAMSVEKDLRDIHIFLLDSIEDCIEFSNLFAPEHLYAMVDYDILKHINSAGSVFIGKYSPVAVGDYISGTNHILPTSGTSRFLSGVSPESFLRNIYYTKLSREELKKLIPYAERIAEVEGMREHINSIKERFKS